MPDELKLMIWGWALMPTRASRPLADPDAAPPIPAVALTRRILNIGPQCYHCSNRDFHKAEDALCIATKLENVSKNTRHMVRDEIVLQDIYRTFGPSQHRLQYKAPGASARYIRCDGQEDILCLSNSFLWQRMETIDGLLPQTTVNNPLLTHTLGPDPQWRHPYDDHPTWITRPNSRPCHVIISLQGMLDLIDNSKLKWSGDAQGAERLVAPNFLAYFGNHFDPTDPGLLRPVADYLGRAWSQLDVALKRITVIVDAGLMEAISASAVRYNAQGLKCLGPTTVGQAGFNFLEQIDPEHLLRTTVISLSRHNGHRRNFVPSVEHLWGDAVTRLVSTWSRMRRRARRDCIKLPNVDLMWEGGT